MSYLRNISRSVFGAVCSEGVTGHASALLEKSVNEKGRAINTKQIYQKQSKMREYPAMKKEEDASRNNIIKRTSVVCQSSLFYNIKIELKLLGSFDHCYCYVRR